MKKLLLVFLLILTSCAWFQPAPEDLMKKAQQTAGSKVTDLTQLSEPPASTDMLMVVDVSDSTMSANGTNKKITLADVWADRRAPIDKTSSYTVGTSNGRECYGGKFTNTGASGSITYTLCDAVAGMLDCFILTAAQNIVIDPYGSERILVLTNSNGDRISGDSTQGSMICLYAINSTQWIRVGSIGTWSDAN